MRPHRYLALCLGEAVQELWRHRRTAAPAVAIIGVSLVVLGGFLLVSANLAELLGRWRQRGHVQVFLRRSVTAEERAAVEGALGSSPAVEAYRYLGPEEAAARFRAEFAELGDVLGVLGDNPLPPSFMVTVRPAFRQEAPLARLAAQWGRLPGVEGVQYDLQLIRRLELGLGGVRLAGLLLGGSVLLAAVITTANVIRVIVVVRRREVEVLRLVGASEAVVRGRFVAEGALHGLLGAGLALAVLFAAYRLGVAYLHAAAGPVLALLPLTFLGPGMLAGLVGCGVAAGLVGAWLAFGAGSGLED